MSLKNNNLSNITNDAITQLCSRSKLNPHYLIELSSRDIKKMKDNSIIVTSFSRTTPSNKKNSTCCYESVSFGKNVVIESNGNDKKDSSIKLSKMLGNYVLILADKDDVLRSDVNTVLIQNDLHQSDTYKPSGYVLLVFAVLDTKNKGGMCWENKHIQMCYQSKANTITETTKHFRSTGSSYSFGNRANYGMINGSSITQYARKKYVNHTSNQISLLSSAEIEVMCANEIRRAIDSLRHYFRNIHLLIAPVISSANKLQKSIGNVNLKEISTSTNGCWEYNVLVNAATDIAHTERDCTYTLITVPVQHSQKKRNTKHNSRFYFFLNNKQSVSLNYNYHLSFVYSAFYITHNQRPSENLSIQIFHSST